MEHTKGSRDVRKIPGKFLKPRNPYADSDLMKKGGAHEKSKAKGKNDARRQIKAALEESSEYM